MRNPTPRYIGAAASELAAKFPADEVSLYLRDARLAGSGDLGRAGEPAADHRLIATQLVAEMEPRPARASDIKALTSAAARRPLSIAPFM